MWRFSGIRFLGIYWPRFSFLPAVVYMFLPVRSFTGPFPIGETPRACETCGGDDQVRLRRHAPSPTAERFPLDCRSCVAPPVYLSAIAGFTIYRNRGRFRYLGANSHKKGKAFQFLNYFAVDLGPALHNIFEPAADEKTTLPILEPHLVMPALYFALLIAAGARSLANRAAVAALVAVLSLVPLYAHFPQCNYRFHFFAWDYGRDLLSTAGRDSLIYDRTMRPAFITSYFQTVCGKRKDVKLVEYFRTRWGYELLKKNIRRSSRKERSHRDRNSQRC